MTADDYRIIVVRLGKPGSRVVMDDEVMMDDEVVEGTKIVMMSDEVERVDRA